jgi:predicted HicB family RNase H-like nuclease
LIIGNDLPPDVFMRDYIETCRKSGKTPDKEFKGSFNVRVKPDLHRLAMAKPKAARISLNQLVERALEREVKGG